MSTRASGVSVAIRSATGDFAEDKDAAANLREKEIRPALAAGKRVSLDFTGVRLATQSFVHALISDVLRNQGESVLDRMSFKGCSKAVKGIVETVVQYSLESLDEPGEEEAGKATALQQPQRGRRKK